MTILWIPVLITNILFENRTWKVVEIFQNIYRTYSGLQLSFLTDLLYSKTCLKRPHSKIPKNGIQDRL